MSNQYNRNIVKYVVPTMLSSVCFFLFTIVDGVFIGHGVGTNGLGAINLVMPFVMVVNAVFMLTTIGGVTIVAIRLGRGDKDGANQAFMHSVIGSVVAALILCVAGVFFSVEDIMKLLEEKKIDEVFGYLEVYRNSLWEEREIKDAEELIRYYACNREGLLPYQSQGLELPEHPEGLEYRNMGTMENHVWSVIARRMKHNHTSWSKRGGNHLAKILAKKCSGKLHEVTEKQKRPVFEEEQVEELYREILMSAKAPKKDGKGYGYPVIGHMVGLNGKIRGDRTKLLEMAGY